MLTDNWTVREEPYWWAWKDNAVPPNLLDDASEVFKAGVSWLKFYSINEYSVSIANSVAEMPEPAQRLIAYLRSEELTDELARMADIPDLEPDTGSHGGTCHRLAGYERMHVPHNKSGDKYRRLQLYLFASPWGPEDGGLVHLSGVASSASILPKWNRVLVLSLGWDRWVGQPAQLREGRTLCSFRQTYLSAQPGPQNEAPHRALWADREE